MVSRKKLRKLVDRWGAVLLVVQESQIAAWRNAAGALPIKEWAIRTLDAAASAGNTHDPCA